MNTMFWSKKSDSELLEAEYIADDVIDGLDNQLFIVEQYAESFPLWHKDSPGSVREVLQFVLKIKNNIKQEIHRRGLK